jgi:hypothetical protein
MQLTSILPDRGMGVKLLPGLRSNPGLRFVPVPGQDNLNRHWPNYVNNRMREGYANTLPDIAPALPAQPG